MKRLALAAASAVAMIVSAPAFAAEITYTLSGTFNGTRDGAEFTTFATFTGRGDTDDVFFPESTVSVTPLSVLFAFADNTTFQVLGATEFFVNRGEQFGGFTLAGGGLDNFITTFNSAAFATYDGVSNISGVAGVVATQPFSFQTDQGAIVINNVTNITFSAAVAADAAVPEPATWGMMLLGFGLAGASMRSRRRRTAVTYA